MPDITWHWYPRPPEMIQAERDLGPTYLFECVGTCNGERVWIPDGTTPYNRDVVAELKEKHGTYAESLGKARQLDAFIETYNQHSFEDDESYQLRQGERHG